MKISIGNVKDKNIKNIIEKNLNNGYSVYSDGKEYYVDVLVDGSSYRSIDCNFLYIPSGMYKIKNNIVYTVDDVQSWINL
jgi:hypothetical protein